MTITEAQERLGKIPTKKAAPDHKRKKPASKKSEPTAREVILKIISRYKKGVTISKLKELTRFDDKKIRNVLYFAAKQRKIKGLSRGVYAMK